MQALQVTERTLEVLDGIKSDSVELAEVDQPDDEHEANKSLSLTRYDIIDLWERGVINDAAYIELAMRFEKLNHGNDFDLHINRFISDWEGIPDEKGKCKTLTEEKVRKGVASLTDKGSLVSRSSQLKLKFV